MALCLRSAAITVPQQVVEVALGGEFLALLEATHLQEYREALEQSGCARAARAQHLLLHQPNN